MKSEFKDVTDVLLAKKVDTEELGQIVLGYFGRGEGARYFKEGQRDSFLELKFSNKGILQKVVACGISKAELGALRKKIQECLIDNQVEKIGQSIAFATSPIRGYFRYKELFQVNPILKLPEDSIPFLFPFVLQYKYVSSRNIFVNFRRKEEAFIRIVRYLNLIINSKIELKTSHSVQLWTYAEDGKSSEWRHAGYIPQEPLGDLKEFAPFRAEQRVDRIPLTEYFKHPGYGINEDLQMASQSDLILDKIFSLKGEVKEKFDHSVVWFGLSHNLNSISASSSFNALATSIECMLPGSNVKCEDCGQPIYKISKQFLNFLKTYAPSSPELEGKIERLYKKYYPKRSKLVHGSALFDSDEQPWLFASRKSDEEGFLGGTFRQSVRLALINWVMIHGTSAGSRPW